MCVCLCLHLGGGGGGGGGKGGMDKLYKTGKAISIFPLCAINIDVMMLTVISYTYIRLKL